MQRITSMQISDSHSKASTHPVQLSQDDERVTLRSVETDEQKLREDIIFFIDLQNRRHWEGPLKIILWISPAQAC